MQQNVRVNVNNRGCCSGIVGAVLLIVAVTVVAGWLGKLAGFVFSVPGVILIGALVVAAAIAYSRRRTA